MLTEYEIKLLRQSKKEACSNQVFYNGTCYTSPHKKPRLPNGADKIISEDGA